MKMHSAFRSTYMCESRLHFLLCSKSNPKTQPNGRRSTGQ